MEKLADFLIENKTRLGLGFLFAVVFFVRFVGLELSPPGAFSDELSFGYSAYSIAETGRDEHGIPFPVFFEALGDYKNPVFVYLLIPFVKFLDLSVFTVRFASAVFGLASILLFGYFMYLFSRSKKLALLGMLVLSVMPWHFFYSRIGFEAVVFIFFLVLSMVFFAKFIRTKQEAYFLFFGVSMVVTFFSYSTARLMIPLLALAIAVLWWREIFLHRPVILASVLSLLLLGGVLHYDNIVNSNGVTSRAGKIAIWNQSPSSLATVGHFFRNYLNHFSPQFLFQSGDYNSRHSSGVSSMMFTSFAAPFLIGLAYFARRLKDSRFAKFILFALVAFPLASSLTIIEEGAQATRSIHVVPFLAILVTYGVWETFIFFRERQKAILYALGAFFIVEIGFFFWNYFAVYPIKSADDFNYGLPEAFETAVSSNADYYYISKNISNYSGIEAPFFFRYDPNLLSNNRIIPFIQYVEPSKLENPRPNSIGIFREGDDIKHFPNEELLHVSSYKKRVVEKNVVEDYDYYSERVVNRYYVYRYR